MSVRQTAEPEYGNWVSTRLIYDSIAMSVPFFALSFVSSLFVVGAIPFLLSLAYFAYAHHRPGQRLQDRVSAQPDPGPNRQNRKHKGRQHPYAETPRLVTGPTLVGENQEKIIDSIAATLKVVRAAE